MELSHTLSALDGKHVAIQKPSKSGSEYQKYKSFFSLVMLALVGPEYQFLWVDVGANGVCSDAQIFNGCSLMKTIERERR